MDAGISRLGLPGVCNGSDIIVDPTISMIARWFLPSLLRCALLLLGTYHTSRDGLAIYVKWLQQAWTDAPNTTCQVVFILQILFAAFWAGAYCMRIYGAVTRWMSSFTWSENPRTRTRYQAMTGTRFPEFESNGSVMDPFEAIQFAQEVQTYLAQFSTLCDGAYASSVSGGSLCCVCLQKFQEDDRCRQLRCKHVMHLHCIDPWLCKSQECPVCRQKIEMAEVSGDGEITAALQVAAAFAAVEAAKTTAVEQAAAAEAALEVAKRAAVVQAAAATAAVEAAQVAAVEVAAAQAAAVEQAAAAQVAVEAAQLVAVKQATAAQAAVVQAAAAKAAVEVAKAAAVEQAAAAEAAVNAAQVAAAEQAAAAVEAAAEVPAEASAAAAEAAAAGTGGAAAATAEAASGTEGAPTTEPAPTAGVETRSSNIGSSNSDELHHSQPDDRNLSDDANYRQFVSTLDM